MKISGDSLYTPLYMKLDKEFDWPTHEPVFYLITRDGMMLCRNGRFGRSCVPAKKFPSELGKQESFCESKYPLIPQVLLERVVGFFNIIAKRHNSEAGALIVWDGNAKAVDIVIPKQFGIVSSYTGYDGKKYSYGSDMEYTVPNLPPHLSQIGDIHSHVDMSAYASATDEYDEKHRAGIHLVVGRISKEPPEFHCEIVADGHRFRVSEALDVATGYKKRRVKEVPQDWLDQFATKEWKSKGFSRDYDSSDAVWEYDPKLGYSVRKEKKNGKAKNERQNNYQGYMGHGGWE